MEIGPLTQRQIATFKQNAGCKPISPDEFTEPFSDRLADFIENYYPLPQSPTEKNKTVAKYINDCSKETGIQFSRTTRDAWLSNERDPSLTSSENGTRENIYKLAALLGYDYDLTCELFEKVFFARPFNQKNIKELVYYYCAKNTDEYISTNWYTEGEKLLEKISKEKATDSSNSIKYTDIISSRVEKMNEEEFLSFIRRNKASFEKQNNYVTATESIAALVNELSRQVTGYDTLIDSITGFSSRSTVNGTENITIMRSIPAHIRSNFPSGLILKEIISGKEKSGDKIQKMLKLLMFYHYFYQADCCQDTSSQFEEFYRYSSAFLGKLCLTDLYPRNPFDALILSCAACENPIKSFQGYFQGKIDDENYALQKEKMLTSFKSIDEKIVENVLNITNRDAYLINLICTSKGKYGVEYLSAMVSDISKMRLEFMPDEGWKDSGSPYWTVLQYLLDNPGFDEDEIDVLRLACLFPNRKLSSDMMILVLNTKQQQAAFRLKDLGYLKTDDENWIIDYRIKQAVFDQEYEPNRSNMEKFRSVLVQNTMHSEIAMILKKMNALDELI